MTWKSWTKREYELDAMQNSLLCYYRSKEYDIRVGSLFWIGNFNRR